VRCVVYLQRLATLTDIDDIVDMAVGSRNTGSIRRQMELIPALNRDPNSVDFTRERPEEIAFLLNRFLCDLPDRLLTFNLEELFISATCEFEKRFFELFIVTCIWPSGLPNDEERKRLLHMLTLILPRSHRDMLEVLLVFLKRVSSFAAIQDDIGAEFYLTNLTSVIGPRVLFSSNWDHLSVTKVDGERETPDFGTGTMTELLKNQDEFFTVPKEFLPLMHDQDFFAGSMELSSKEFLKRCQTYMHTKDRLQ
jgi:hypothetical protein